jgi:HEAT repeat protein
MGDDLSDNALLAELESRVEGSRIGDPDAYLGLIADVGRRRLAAAAPLLETIVRRGIGYERAYPAEYREVPVALRALAAIRDGRTATLVLQALAETPPRFSTAGTAAALDYLGAVRNPAVATGFLAAPERDIRLATARALGRIGRGEAADALAAALADPAPEIGRAAAVALASMGDHRGRALIRVELARAPDAELIEALALVGEPDDGARLLRHQAHPDAAIRRAVVDALAEIDLQRFRKRIERFRDDADETVRAAARDALEDGA